MTSIPFLHSVEDIFLFLLIATRVAGLFLISPLISNSAVTRSVRSMLVVFIAAIITMTLYESYRGEVPSVVVPELRDASTLSAAKIAYYLFRELAIGYLIGFAFTLLFEALLLAGQQVGSMIGFSISEVFDPLTNTSQPMMGQLFTLTASLMIFSLDLHHVFITTTVQSFMILPLASGTLAYELLQEITAGSAHLFEHAIRFGAIPFAVMLLVTVGLGFVSKVMPEMNILMTAFPLRIYIGFYTLVLAIDTFPRLLQGAFVEYDNLAHRIIHSLSRG